jgi:hypothetical protein
MSLPNTAPSRNGAEQEQREELRDEARPAAHEGLRPVGEQRLSREGGAQQRRSRGEQ